MKKNLLLFSFIAVCMFASAKPVDPADAKRVAQTWLASVGTTGHLVDITSQTPFTEFYIFASEEGGFVIVSADDCVMPILGYSPSSVFAPKDIPENVQGWLEEYESEIRFCRDNYGDYTDNTWAMLIAGIAPEPPSPTAVSPLVSTTWNQNPYYNSMCPYDNSASARTVTGCVATATAQIMKKWGHPSTGYGSHSYTASNTHTAYGTLTANFGSTNYAWSTMPNALTSTSSTAQINAVATLMYHIGVAVEMGYDVAANGGSSAANTNSFGYVGNSSAEAALQKYFKYRSDMATIARVDYTNSQWINKLKSELNAGRPILFSGRDATGGHSFVCDGYNNSNQFHINWGWGGTYDGYYAMGALNPGGGGTGSNAGTYNSENVALIKIQPNNNWSSSGTTTVTANATGGSGCSVTGGGSHAFGDTVRLTAVAATGYHFKGWSDGTMLNPREFIANGGSLSFTAQFEALGGDTITYCPGNRYLQSLGASSGATTWGMRIPTSAFSTGRYLAAVQFFASSTGSYTLTIYSGTSSPTTTLRTTNYNTASTGWQQINITPVAIPTGKDIWITFTSSASYPAAMSYSGGHNYGLLYGSALSYAGYAQCSFMIRGIFQDNATPIPTNDTCTIASFPHTQNFSNGAPCWTVFDRNGDGINWQLVTYNNNPCVYARYSSNTVSDDWLISPPITGAGYYTLTWKDAAYNSNYTETYSVCLINGNDTTVLSNRSTYDTEFNTRSVSFNIASGDTVKIAFRYTSNDQYYLFIDDFQISRLSETYISYCGNSSSSGCYGIPEWGIMIPSGMYSGYNYLKSVKVYIEYGGTYTLKVYRGGTQSPQTLVHTQSATFNYNDGWQEIVVNNTIPLSNNNIWITFTSTANVAATFCSYTGDVNGTWWKLSGSWGHPSPLTSTWMIKAMVTTNQWPPQHTITVNSFNPNMGTTSGGGIFYLGSTTTISATANSGYTFNCWQDGNTQNPRTITVTGDATYTAYFLNLYTVTVESNDETMGTASGGGTYPENSTVTLTASPYTGYHFTRWNDGSTNAIRTVTVNSNVTYTAFFEANPPGGDTLSYCSDNEYVTSVGANNSFLWGIMLPPTMITGKYLKSVMLYVPSAGTYNMNVYRGGTTSPRTQIYSHTRHFSSTQRGWQEIPLSSYVNIKLDDNIWIVFDAPDLQYPAAACNYSNNPNSDWVSTNGTSWDHLVNLNSSMNYTWMIKAVVVYSQGEIKYTINAYSNNESWGTVSGDGYYPWGSTVTLQATPKNGKYFVGWSDGSTSPVHSVTVAGNATYVATFSTTNAIDDADTATWSFYPNPATRMVTLVGVRQGVVSITDLSGRTLLVHNIKNDKDVHVDICGLAAGAYFLRVINDNGASVKKLIIE